MRLYLEFCEDAEGEYLHLIKMSVNEIRISNKDLYSNFFCLSAYIETSDIKNVNFEDFTVGFGTWPKELHIYDAIYRVECIKDKTTGEIFDPINNYNEELYDILYTSILDEKKYETFTAEIIYKKGIRKLVIK